MIKENFIKIYEESFKENWALPALTDYGKSKTFTFGDVATEIARIHLLFHECLYGGCYLWGDYRAYSSGL